MSYSNIKCFATRPHAYQAMLAHDPEIRIAIYDQLWHRGCGCDFNKKKEKGTKKKYSYANTRPHTAYSRIFTDRQTAEKIEELTGWELRENSSISRKDQGLAEILAIGLPGGATRMKLRGVLLHNGANDVQRDFLQILDK